MEEISRKEGRAFSFLGLNRRDAKPRQRGITEIRGPYYTPIGKRQLEDIFETFGEYVDILKFAGGSFSLMPAEALRDIIDLAHAYGVEVDTGGFIEHVLARDADAVGKYIEECKDFEFDIIEVSKGFISIPADDMVRLTSKIVAAGLRVKAEVGIQFGAGGASPARELESEGVQDPGWAIQQAKRHLDAGASMIMVESEGITEGVSSWRTDVISEFIGELGLDRVMFEAADPEVFTWYVKNYGPEVNLFVDHSQIALLESLRSGIWGTKDVWGRIITYKP
ncbi:MAG: phosphosulfolactate synthase [Deltaproteobacteria bacterium]|nr:phosphosulfolactate synthase [Deltaproteobacteria bacterium]MBZ0219770.1 phosphosulfolactate synthase [Deltaproteobacteria bacterium]